MADEERADRQQDGNEKSSNRGSNGKAGAEVQEQAKGKPPNQSRRSSMLAEIMEVTLHEAQIGGAAGGRARDETRRILISNLQNQPGKEERLKKILSTEFKMHDSSEKLMNDSQLSKTQKRERHAGITPDLRENMKQSSQLVFDAVNQQNNQKSNQAIVSLGSPHLRASPKESPSPMKVDNTTNQSVLQGQADGFRLSENQGNDESQHRASGQKQVDTTLMDYNTGNKSPLGLLRPQGILNNNRQEKQGHWKKIKFRVINRNSQDRQQRLGVDDPSCDNDTRDDRQETTNGSQMSPKIVVRDSKLRTQHSLRLQSQRTDKDYQAAALNQQIRSSRQSTGQRRQMQISPLRVSKPIDHLGPICIDQRIQPLTARDSQIGNFNNGLPNTLSPRRPNATAIRIHELNVMKNEQATTNWRKCKGNPRPARNQWTIEMQRKANKFNSKRFHVQGAAFEIDLNFQLEKIANDARLKPDGQPNHPGSSNNQTSHKVAMMRVLQDAVHVCQRVTDDLLRKRKLKSKVKTNSLSVESRSRSKERKVDKCVDILQKDSAADLSKIPETDKSSSSNEVTIEVSLSNSIVHEQVNEIKRQIEILEQLNKIKRVTVDSCIEIKRIGSPKPAKHDDPERPSPPAGTMINLNLSPSQILQTKALREEMKAIEELVKKRGAQLAQHQGENAKQHNYQALDASPFVQQEMKNQKTRTQHLKRRQRRLLSGSKRASMQQNAPRLIPTDRYLQNVSKLAPDEQIQLLKKRVRQLWRQVSKAEENEQFLEAPVEESKSRNILYYQRDTQQSSRVATANERRNRSRCASNEGNLSQHSKMLIATGSTKDLGLKEVHGPDKIQISFQSHDSKETIHTSLIAKDDKEVTRINQSKYLASRTRNTFGRGQLIQQVNVKNQQKQNPASLFVSKMRLEPLEAQCTPRNVQNLNNSYELPQKQKIFLNALNRQPQTAVFPFTPINQGTRKEQRGLDTLYLQNHNNSNNANTNSGQSPRGAQMRGSKHISTRHKAPISKTDTLNSLGSPTNHAKKASIAEKQQDIDIGMAGKNNSTAARNPLSQHNLRESLGDQVSFTGYKASLPSQQSNMRIQYDIDEFMKNATQYLNNSYKQGIALTDGMISVQNQRSSQASKHDNRDINSIMVASGNSLKFKHILNMPFTPPQNQLSPIRRRQFSVHINNNLQAQKNEHTPQDAISTDQQPNSISKTGRVLSDDGDKRDQYTYKDGERNSGLTNRNSDMYKVLQHNKDQLRLTQKNINNPSSFRKVTFVKKNPQQNSTTEKAKQLATSKFSRNSDMISSNYQVMTPNMNVTIKVPDLSDQSKINKDLMHEANLSKVELTPEASAEKDTSKKSPSDSRSGVAGTSQFAQRIEAKRQAAKLRDLQISQGSNAQPMFDSIKIVNKYGEMTPFVGHLNRGQQQKVENSSQQSNTLFDMNQSPCPTEINTLMAKKSYMAEQNDPKFAQLGQPNQYLENMNQVLHSITQANDQQARSALPTVPAAKLANSQQYALAGLQKDATFQISNINAFGHSPEQQKALLGSGQVPYHYLAAIGGPTAGVEDGQPSSFVSGLLNQQQIFIANNNSSYGQIREGDVDEEDDDANLQNSIKSMKRKNQLRVDASQALTAPHTQRWKGLSGKKLLFKDKSVERIRQQFGKSGIRLDLLRFGMKKAALPEIVNNSMKNGCELGIKAAETESLPSKLAAISIPKRSIHGIKEAQSHLSPVATRFQRHKEIAFLNQKYNFKPDASPMQTSRYQDTEGTLEFDDVQASKQEYLHNVSSKALLDQSQQMNMSRNTQDRADKLGQSTFQASDSASKLQQIVQSAVIQAQSTLKRALMKRHGSLEGPRDGAHKSLSIEKSNGNDHNYDSVNKSFDALNSSYQELSRIEASEDMLQKSVLLNQSLDSAGMVPSNLANFQNYDHEELAEYAQLQRSTCLLNNRNKQELNVQISKMIGNQSADSAISIKGGIEPSPFQQGAAAYGLGSPGIILLTCERVNAAAPRKSLQSRKVSAQYKPYMKYRNIQRSKERSKEGKQAADFEQLDLLLKSGLH